MPGRTQRLQHVRQISHPPVEGTLTEHAGEVRLPVRPHVADKAALRTPLLPVRQDGNGKHLAVTHLRLMSAATGLLGGKLRLIYVIDMAVDCRQEGVQIDLHDCTSWGTCPVGSFLLRTPSPPRCASRVRRVRRLPSEPPRARLQPSCILAVAKAVSALCGDGGQPRYMGRLKT